MRRSLAVGLLIGGMLAAGTGPARGAAAPAWHEIFVDAFNTPTALGAFTDCDHAVDTPQAYCGGLTGSMRANWWAYPAGWPDTAKQWDYPVGGTYDPATTVWVAPSAWGDGQLHVRMWRGASGDVHSAALVPKKVMGLTYGKVEVRFRVSASAPGYKSADMLWGQDQDACSNCEDDFGEGNWNGQINGFAHHEDMENGNQDGYSTGIPWTTWHTGDIEWTPDAVEFWLDGARVGRSTDGVPDQPMDWILQNESALTGATAAPNSSAQMDISWVQAWNWS